MAAGRGRWRSLVLRADTPTHKPSSGWPVPPLATGANSDLGAMSNIQGKLYTAALTKGFSKEFSVV